MLNKLETAKRLFGHKGIAQLDKTLALIARRKFEQPEDLVRLHESLLFFRAYPPSAQVLRAVEKLIADFEARIQRLKTKDVDLAPLNTPEVSGIVGTSVVDTFSFNIVCWVKQRYPTRIALDWEWFEDDGRLAATWPRFMPLLEEDAYVEANVPYQEWLRVAKGKARQLDWLLQRFEALPLSDAEKAELYDSQKLYVCWKPPRRATRTLMKLPIKKVFYHRQPLLTRRDVSLKEELQNPSFEFQNLSAHDGEKILNLARETSTVRYRELYGFTHGDPKQVIKVSIGRGVDLFVSGLPPAHRLPLRAYHAALIFKNGVPVAYFEGLSLFERMESGFNLYYTFREGETAWLYAKTLGLFRQLLGVSAFSIDPYQIGYQNEEGIESGAFWFYRKLGFRPTRTELLELTRQEEDRLASRPGYRTPARVLRQLAEGSMIFELDSRSEGDWDNFSVRKIGLTVQRRIAAEFRSDPGAFRKATANKISQVVGLEPGKLEVSLAPALAMIDDLDQWTDKQKRLIRQILRAKASKDEARYLKLMQQHKLLRTRMIELGSS